MFLAQNKTEIIHHHNERFISVAWEEHIWITRDNSAAFCLRPTTSPKNYDCSDIKKGRGIILWEQEDVDAVAVTDVEHHPNWLCREDQIKSSKDPLHIKEARADPGVRLPHQRHRKKNKKKKKNLNLVKNTGRCPLQRQGSAVVVGRRAKPKEHKQAAKGEAETITAEDLPSGGWAGVKWDGLSERDQKKKDKEMD